MTMINERNTAHPNRSGRIFRVIVGIGTVSMLGWACGILGPDLDGLGTVEFFDFPGGCWGIRTNKDVYEPINLCDEFKVDGLRVEFEAAFRKDLNSPCQMGPLIEIEKITRLDSTA